jgi:uncharacterized protein DUF6325
MDFYESGPVDILMLRLPGTRFRDEIAHALRDLAGAEQIRVVDLLFVAKDADGTVTAIPLDELHRHLAPLFVGPDGHLGGGLLDGQDVTEAARGLEHDSSVTVVVIENRWATPLVRLVRDLGGDLLDRAPVPAIPPAARAGTSDGAAGAP